MWRTSVATLFFLGLTFFGAFATPRSVVHADDYVLLSGKDWLGGNGVDVYRNNPDYTGKWQCVELINRLYQTSGWIKGNWRGNGNDMFGTAAAVGLKSEDSDGNITIVNPGDVIVLGGGVPFIITDAKGNKTTVYYGHVAVVDSVDGSTIHTVSQNLSQTNPRRDMTWDKAEKKIVPWSSFWVIGIVHAPSTTPPPPPPRVYDGSQLGPTSTLLNNHYLSANGYVLWFEPSGELSLYGPGNTKVWWAGTSGKGGMKLVMQGDNNLVMFNASGGVVWASGSNSSVCTNCAHLVIVPGGALAIQGSVPTEPVLWSTNWSLTPQPSLVGPEIGPGSSLSLNQYLMNNNYRLSLQLDGNIVLWGQASEVLWTPGIADQGGVRLTVQADDNVVLFRQDNSVVWASGTNWASSTCTSCALLSVMSDGVLIIFGQIPSEPTFWSTNWGATPAHTSLGTSLGNGQTLYLGEFIQTAGGELVLQADGNLVFWLNNGTIGWTPFTAGSGADRLTMLGSGVAVLTPPGSYPAMWSSGTQSSCGCAQMDILSAALVIDATINGSTTYLWSTNWNVTPH